MKINDFFPTNHEDGGDSGYIRTAEYMDIESRKKAHQHAVQHHQDEYSKIRELENTIYDESNNLSGMARTLTKEKRHLDIIFFEDGNPRKPRTRLHKYGGSEDSVQYYPSDHRLIIRKSDGIVDIDTDKPLEITTILYRIHGEKDAWSDVSNNPHSYEDWQSFWEEPEKD